MNTQQSRPRTVTIAAALLAVQAILALVGLAVSVALRETLTVEASAGNALAKQFAGGPTGIGPLGVGAALLLSVALFALAAFVLRGSGPARLAARVFSGLGLLGFVIGGLYATPSLVTRPEPRWYLEYSGFASGLVLVIYAAIIVLLTLRPSREYRAS